MEDKYIKRGYNFNPELIIKSIKFIRESKLFKTLNSLILKIFNIISMLYAGRLFFSFANIFSFKIPEKLNSFTLKIFNFFSMLYAGRLFFSFANTFSFKKIRVINFHRDHIVLKIKKRYIFAALVVITLGFAANIYIINLKNNNIMTSEQKIQEITKTKEELQSQLEQLETENKGYKENLYNLEEKAEEIENKLNELNDVKTDLYNKLDNISMKNNLKSKNTVYAFENSTDLNGISSDKKSENISDTQKMEDILKNLENTVKHEEVEYIDVSKTITETLSYLQKTPSIWPVKGAITSDFGIRTDPLAGFSDFHPAIDIQAAEGTPVKATANGTVVVSEYNSGGYGYMVKINHGNGYKTLYAHNSKLVVKVGDIVKKGDIIAYSGSTGRVTGPHVHYEVILNDKNQNPLDYLK